MAENLEQFTLDLAKKINQFETEFSVKNVGRVVEAGDGIARVTGLTEVRAQELVEFENGIKGIAFNLEKEHVGVIIMGDYSKVTENMQVQTTGRIASIQVGEEMIGRVVNTLGEPLDGKGPIKSNEYMPLERVAPGVIERRDVNAPVQTGIKAIDSMIPIGRGQRELIIGDRQTGKSAIAIDTIINQKGKDLVCIYVAIGQKKATIARIKALLESYGAMDHTVIVLASADESAAMQYIAPYAGCAIGESIMEKGGHALVIYDDLSKHAWAYRQISLLLRRPPGREAYPGDVFYLHSRLLERAACMAYAYVILPNDFEGDEISRKDIGDAMIYSGPVAHELVENALNALKDKDRYKIVRVKESGGTLTALPIIETLLGDVSAYIPTNVISITDGQIFLSPNLFELGVLPAVDIGKSVSRVGGKAQKAVYRTVVSDLKLAFAQYEELESFARYGARLDEPSRKSIDHGRRIQACLMQSEQDPFTFEEQVLILIALTDGQFESVPLERMQAAQQALRGMAAHMTPELKTRLMENPTLSDADRDSLVQLARQGLARVMSTPSEDGPS